MADEEILNLIDLFLIESTVPVDADQRSGSHDDCGGDSHEQILCHINLAVKVTPHGVLPYESSGLHVAGELHGPVALAILLHFALPLASSAPIESGFGVGLGASGSGAG